MIPYRYVFIQFPSRYIFLKGKFSLDKGVAITGKFMLLTFRLALIVFEEDLSKT